MLDLESKSQTLISRSLKYFSIILLLFKRKLKNYHLKDDQKSFSLIKPVIVLQKI